MKKTQKEIINYIPRELADPRTHTISLAPIKEILTQGELTKDNLLQTYRDEIERLTKVIQSTASPEIYRLFREKLCLFCFQTNTTITILQCAEKMKRGHCKGCRDRNRLLETLGALPR